MPGQKRLLPLQNLLAWFILLLGLFGCSASEPPAQPSRPATPMAATPPLFKPPQPAAPAPATPATPFPVMLGIDVLESQGFAAVKGKRLGLLTHPAGVNRRGESTVNVLRRAPGVKLVALFGPEHGIYADVKAEIHIANSIDARTGLPVYSVYGQTRKPTPAMLKGLDAMVVDLQDVGTRSYTYVSAMLYTMAACFENNVEVIVLDRPNPLGGYKADGPPLDAQWKSYVGAFRVPYVHGLTIGELARMAKESPGVMQVPNAINVSEAVRAKGKLTVIPMRGWRRSMRWPETGLKWVPTSPMVQDFSAVVGYAMVGLGTYFHLDPKVRFDLGFRHGVGPQYAFRGISHKTVKSDVIERELRAMNLPGLSFRRVSVPGKNGRPETGVYIEVSDWDDWNPTELSFHLMRLACKFDPKNPLRTAGDPSGFLRHMGSTAFFEALKRDGARTNVEAWFKQWQEQAKIYQQQSRKFWLYY
jgi:uncharacterized protein YbbC (DUF1343 family)